MRTGAVFIKNSAHCSSSLPARSVIALSRRPMVVVKWSTSPTPSRSLPGWMAGMGAWGSLHMYGRGAGRALRRGRLEGGFVCQLNDTIGVWLSRLEAKFQLTATPSGEESQAGPEQNGHHEDVE